MMQPQQRHHHQHHHHHHHHRSQSWIGMSPSTIHGEDGNAPSPPPSPRRHPGGVVQVESAAGQRLAKFKAEWKSLREEEEESLHGRNDYHHHNAHHQHHRRVHSSPSLSSCRSPLPPYHGQQLSSRLDEHEKMQAHHLDYYDSSVKSGSKKMGKAGGEDNSVLNGQHAVNNSNNDISHHHQHHSRQSNPSSSSFLCCDTPPSSTPSSTLRDYNNPRRFDHPATPTQHSASSDMQGKTTATAPRSSPAAASATTTPSATYSPTSSSSSSSTTASASASTSPSPIISTRHLGTPDELYEKLRASLDLTSSSSSSASASSGSAKLHRKHRKSKTGTSTPSSFAAGRRSSQRYARSVHNDNDNLPSSSSSVSLPTSRIHSKVPSGAASPKSMRIPIGAVPDNTNSSRRSSCISLPFCSSSSSSSSSSSPIVETPRAILPPPPPFSSSAPAPHSRTSRRPTASSSTSFIKSLVTVQQAISISLYILVTILASLTLITILVSSYGLTIADDVRLKIGNMGRKADQRGRRIALDLAEWVRNANEQIQKRKTALEQGARKSRSRRPSASAGTTRETAAMGGHGNAAAVGMDKGCLKPSHSGPDEGCESSPSYQSSDCVPPLGIKATIFVYATNVWTRLPLTHLAKPAHFFSAPPKPPFSFPTPSPSSSSSSPSSSSQQGRPPPISQAKSNLCPGYETSSSSFSSSCPSSEYGSQQTSPSPSLGTKKDFPPRPPLRSLIPSILLALLLALIALIKTRRNNARQKTD